MPCDDPDTVVSEGGAQGLRAARFGSVGTVKRLLLSLAGVIGCGSGPMATAMKRPHDLHRADAGCSYCQSGKQTSTQLAKPNSGPRLSLQTRPKAHWALLSQSPWLPPQG